MLLAAALGTAVLLIAPQQLPVLLYKVLLVDIAALVGYWLDRSLFPYARPDEVFSADARSADAVGEVSFSFAESAAQQLANSPEPEAWRLQLFAWCMVRRAAIVLGAMLAVGLGA